MKQETGKKKSKLWLWLVIGLVALLAVAGVVLALVLGGGGGETGPKGGRPELYWNVDRRAYTENSESGLSTREPGEDGTFKVRFAINGELVEYTVADKQLINFIDTMDAMGLVKDSDGTIVDVVDPKDIAKEVNKNAYVKSTTADKIIANTSVAMNGMNINVKLEEGLTEIYDVTPEAEVPGQKITLADLRPMDTLVIYANDLDQVTHIYVNSHSKQSKVYWRADQNYNSTEKATARVPDENGAYSILFFCEGEVVELKTKDKAIATKIDSVSRWKCHFGLTFDEEGYIIEQFPSAIGIQGVVIADCWDIVDIQGDTYTIQRLTTNDGSTWTGTIPAGTTIYEAGVKAKQEGEGGRKIDSLQLGDRVTVWTDTNGEVVLVYVAERLVDCPAFWLPTRKYSSTTKETTREIGPSGYYEVELIKEGSNKKEIYYVKDKETMSYIDSQTSKIVGLKVLPGNIVEFAYNSEALTGYTVATRGGVVTAVTGSIFTKITYGKRGTDVNLVLAPNAKVYNVSSYGELGAETTIQPGDHVYACRQPTGEILLAYVTKRTIGGEKLYWNLQLMWDKTNLTSTRVPDADGWYHFTMAYRGKQVELKTKNKELVDKIDKLSIGACALDVSGGVIYNVYDAAYPYGGSKVASGYRYEYITSEGKYHCYYNTDRNKTVEFAMADDCVIYNVSPIFKEFKGERVYSIPKDAMLTVFCDIYGEAKVVYVRSQNVKDMYWKSEIRYDSSKKETLREPDADGYYWFNLAVNGKNDMYKTKDKSIANSMDSYAGAFGLSVGADNEIKAFVATSSVSGVSGNGFTTATVTAINGRNVTVETSAGTEKMKLSSNAKIYDVSPVAKNFGEVTKLKVGDVIRTYLNKEKTEHNYVYIKGRPSRVHGEVGYCEVCKEEVKWTPMGNSSAITAADGHWYVPADMTQWVQSSFASTSKDFTICLDMNGKVLTRSENGRNFRVAEGETMNIVDSVGGGKIVTSGKPGLLGGVFLMSAGGTVNVYDGVTIEFLEGYENGNGGIANMSGAGTTFNLYDGHVVGGNAGANQGGNFNVTSNATLNVYGGTITGGRSANGNNIYCSGNLNLYGGTITDGDVYYAGGSVAVSGNPKVSHLEIAKGLKLTVGEMTEGAEVKVNAHSDSPIFSNTVAEAWDYVEAGYFKAYRVAKAVAVTADDELTIDAGEAPTEIFFCEHCNAEVEFTAWGGDSGDYIKENAHYYLAENVAIASNYRIGDSTKPVVNVVFELNGFNINSTGNVFYVYPNGTLTIQDSKGTSVVNGAGVERSSKPGEGGLIYVEGSSAKLNIYGGTYNLAATNKVSNGGVMRTGGTTNIYGGTFNGNTVAGEGGVIYSTYALNIYGGTFNNGDIYVKKALKLENAPVISGIKLDNTKITLGALTEGADITINDEGKIFTESNENAKAYLDAGYFKASANQEITVTENNELEIGEIYHEGQMKYECPHCNGAVATFLPYNVNEIGKELHENGHFYIPDGGYQHNPEQHTVYGNMVIDLRGQTLTGMTGKRVWLIYGEVSIVDTVGGGKVESRVNPAGSGGLAMIGKGDAAVPGTLNLYGGTLTVAEGHADALDGGILILTGGATFNMYDGTLAGGVIDPARKGVNIYSSAATLNLQGGTIDGGIYLSGTATANLSGAMKISANNGGLFVDKNVKISVDGLKEEAEIYVSVPETALITEPLADANAMLSIVKPALTGWEVVARNDCLMVTDGNEPFDPNTVYEKAKAMDFSGADAEGKVTAVCPVCEAEVEWNVLPANPNTSSLATLASGHYYLSETVDYTQNKGLYSFVDKQICINLNGQNLTSTVRAFYTEKTSTVLNMMGDGVVTGAGYMGTGSNVGKGYGTFDLTSNANFYGGTYISTGVGPAIGNRKTSSGDALVSIYAGTTVINENPDGCAMNVMGNGSIAINGGTVNGAVIDNNSKGITVSGAPVINALDLTNGTLLNVGTLTSDAKITVKADGVFTKDFAVAQKYLDNGYFVSGVENGEVIVEGNALAIKVEEPEDPVVEGNLVYEKAVAMDFTAGGTVEAVCPVCGTEQNWVELPAPTSSKNSQLPAGHYYVAEDLNVTKFWYIADKTNGTVCVNLNGKSITNTAERVFYAENIANVLNIMGEGTVIGIAKYNSANTNYIGVLDICTAVNLYGGTYCSTSECPVVSNRGSGVHSVVNIYEGTEIVRTSEDAQGLNLFIADRGTVNMYGGLISGGTAIEHPALGVGKSGGNVLLKANLSANNYDYDCSFNLYGGTVENGTAENLGGNIATIGNDIEKPSATVNICGGTVANGSVCAQGSNAVVNISGNPSVDYLEMAAANLVNVADMTDGASVKVSAALGVPFTTTIGAKAADYAQYFCGTGNHTVAIAKEDALVLEDVCPHCNVPLAEITWTELRSNADNSPITMAEGGHYKLAEDLDSTGNTITFNDSTKAEYDAIEVIIDTAGFDIKGGGRAVYINKGHTLTIFDSVGGSEATSRSTNTGLGGSAMYAHTGTTVNVYDLTFNASPNVQGNGSCISVYGSDAVMNIYSGTFNGNTNEKDPLDAGTVNVRGTLNIYGGTFNASIAPNAKGNGIYVLKKTGKLTIADATVHGNVYIDEQAELTLSGNAKVDNVIMVSGAEKATLGELTEGAEITFTADGAFAESANAQAYVDAGYIKAAEGKQISVEGNTLSMAAVSLLKKLAGFFGL